MSLDAYRHPFWFYALSLVIPWSFWTVAAFLSHQPNAAAVAPVVAFAGLAGLLAPMFIAAVLIGVSPTLRRDVVQRLLPRRKIPVIYWVLTGGLMAVSILFAQLISLVGGHDSSQFSLATQLSFTSVLFPPLLVLLGAPIVEELAWHTYGTDCLVRKGDLFGASMVFALYWALWHIPLSFIEGYYHANLVLEGWVYGANFLVSIFPFVILMNWLYFKTGRNIFVAVIFHLTANLFNELFATHPDSKVIQTGLLLVLAIVVLVKEKTLFFSRDPGVLEGKPEGVIR